MASLTLALVWGAARLAQPLQPECPHHAMASAETAGASTSTTASVATLVAQVDPHAHHHAAEHEAAVASTPLNHDTHHPASGTAPCECAAHCCAASAVAVAAEAPSLHHATITPVRVSVAPNRSSAPRALLSHRQPPATAPPTTVV